MEQVEQMCDEVCLIDRGTRVLGGTLDEIKRRFGRNSLLLGYSGSPSFLSNETFRQVSQHPDHVEIVVDGLVEAQEVLREALAAGAIIHRFQMVEPTLNDIFIEIVGDQNGQDRNDHRL